MRSLGVLQRRNLSVALVLAALAVAGRAQAAEQTTGTWLKDPINGCTVWLDSSLSQAVASWSGGCKAGKASGRGVLSLFADGRLRVRFDGPMDEGKAVGVGRADFRLPDQDGFAHYEGEFKESDLNGRGVLTMPNGGRAEGDFVDGVLQGYVTYVEPSGAGYWGTVKDNRPEGVGHQIFDNKEEYFGEFRGGKRNGSGTLLVPNGDIYKGEFKEGKPEGHGKLLTAEGGVYEGPFKAGQPDGEGVFTTPEGDVARGRVVNGKPDGTIVFSLKNGGTREEVWRDGKKVKP